MKTTWVKNERQYSWGNLLMAGRWEVGSTNQDGTTGKDDPRKWAARCALPGIKSYLASYATEDEAKAHVERAVRVWVKGLEQ